MRDPGPSARHLHVSTLHNLERSQRVLVSASISSFPPLSNQAKLTRAPHLRRSSRSQTRDGGASQTLPQERRDPAEVGQPPPRTPSTPAHLVDNPQRSPLVKLVILVVGERERVEPAPASAPSLPEREGTHDFNQPWSAWPRAPERLGANLSADKTFSAVGAGAAADIWRREERRRVGSRGMVRATRSERMRLRRRRGKEGRASAFVVELERC